MASPDMVDGESDDDEAVSEDEEIRQVEELVRTGGAREGRVLWRVALPHTRLFSFFFA